LAQRLVQVLERALRELGERLGRIGAPAPRMALRPDEGSPQRERELVRVHQGASAPLGLEALLVRFGAQIALLQRMMEHIPVARRSERLHHGAPRLLDRARALATEQLAESAQRGAQAAHADAQLVEIFGVAAGGRAGGVGVDLLDRRAHVAYESLT